MFFLSMVDIVPFRSATQLISTKHFRFQDCNLMIIVLDKPKKTVSHASTAEMEQ